MKKIGLVLGKFAPLHKGHQYLIETAMKQCNKVYVMVYWTDVIDIPVHKRAEWIRFLYPNLEVIECEDCPRIDGYTPEIMQAHNDYILKMVGNKGITHFFSSEPYGDHVSKALNTVDVRVDINRANIPISGTMIRENPLKYKEYLNDYVYKDLIKKVVFLGAESCGKSTIAEYCAKKFNTEWVHEYGKEYWNEHYVKDGKCTDSDFDCIVFNHCKRIEQKIQEANKFLFVDTNAMTTKMFADIYGCHSNCVDNYANEDKDKYDYWFVCDIDIPYEDTPDRLGIEKRKEMQKQIIADLNKRGIKYTMLNGTLENRFDIIKKALM